METITVTLPDETYKLLQERARRTGKPAHKVLLELLEEALKKNSSALPKQKQSAAQILKASGRLCILSPHLQEKIISSVTLKDVQATFRKRSGKSLSDIIIEQRGSQHHE